MGNGGREQEAEENVYRNSGDLLTFIKEQPLAAGA
jgi:hypothetical protein